MTISELVVKIVADTGQFTSGMKDVTGQLDKAGTGAKGATDKFAALKGALVASGLIAGFVALAKGVADCVKEFAEAEMAAKRLEAVAQMRGLKDGSSRIKDLGDEIQALTGFSGDYVVQLGAELLAQGKSEDQTEELIRAATQLAAITGQDLGSAVKQLTNTYSGMAGQIGRSIPEIKDLTEEELKNGDAIKIINERYSGFAEQLTNTTGTSMDRSKEAFGDLKEVIGQAFAPDSVSAANGFTKAINGMLPVLEYMATHSFGRAIEELWEKITGTTGATTRWEEATRKAAEAETEANRIAIAHVDALKAKKLATDSYVESLKSSTTEELKALKTRLEISLAETRSLQAIKDLEVKLGQVNAELGARAKETAKEVAAAKKKAAEEAARAAAEAAAAEAKAAEEAARAASAAAAAEAKAYEDALADQWAWYLADAEARKKKEAETTAYMIEREDAVAKAKADAYGDSIVAAAKEKEARIKASDEANKKIKQGFESLYNSMRGAVQALDNLNKQVYQNEVDRVNSELETSLAGIDAELQAELAAAGLLDLTESELLQKQLAEAIAAGDTEKAAELQKEIDKLAITQEYEKKKADAVKEAEKQKAQAKYKADMFSWQAGIALAIADAARAIIVGFAQLGPIGGAFAAVGTAVVTGIQLAAMSQAKPVAPAFARGTDYAPGGMALVGEEGPELVNLPRGSRVHTAQETRGGAAPVFNFYSPVALTPSEAEKVFRRTARDMAFQGVL